MINGIILVILFFALAFIIEKTMNVKPTTDLSNKFEYVPIITANIYADLFIILITFTQISVSYTHLTLPTNREV